MALPFQHPFTAVVAGPTGSGKTEFVKRVIQYAGWMIEPPPEKIIYYYAEFQDKLNNELGHMVEFREGCPEMSDFNDRKRALVIIDDLMSECGSEISKLFTKGSHHRDLSICFLMQNFFHQAKEIRTITLNAQYIVLFKNPRDKQQIGTLARQMYGRDSRIMEEAFSMATAEPHGYLLIDLKQNTPDHLRLRSKIMPGESMEVYVSKQMYKGDRMELYRRV